MARRLGRSCLSALIFSLAFGGAVAGLNGGIARARDAQAPKALVPVPAPPWCIEHGFGSDPPACVYENFISCAMAAIAHGNWCRSRSSLAAQDAANQSTPASLQASQGRAHALPHHHKAAAHKSKITNLHQVSKISASPHHKISAEKREELFHEFVHWKLFRESMRRNKGRAHALSHHHKAAAHRSKITTLHQDSKIDASPHHEIPAAGREELFREFMRWKLLSESMRRNKRLAR